MKLDTKSTIDQIRASLMNRSTIKWRVTSPRTTAYGWICITSSKARCIDGSTTMTPADASELWSLLGLSGEPCLQGVRIQPTEDFYREYIDRAAGMKPMIYGNMTEPESP